MLSSSLCAGMIMLKEGKALILGLLKSLSLFEKNSNSIKKVKYSPTNMKIVFTASIIMSI
jgi:hypothetical protein